MTTPWLSVVVPAFNEAERVEKTLDALVAYFRDYGRPFEILVVDDGSRDETATIVERRKDDAVRVLRLHRNEGKGAAVRLGVAASLGERVLLSDADLAFPLSQFPRFSDRLDDGYDIACGSRELAGSEALTPLPFHRRRMGQTFNWFARLLGLTRSKDTQCGFKLFDGEAARDILRRCRVNRFAFDVELLLVAARLGYDVSEVPVAWRHVPESRVHLIIDAFRMFADLLRIRLAAWMGRCPRKPQGPSSGSR